MRCVKSNPSKSYSNEEIINLLSADNRSIIHEIEKILGELEIGSSMKTWNHQYILQVRAAGLFSMGKFSLKFRSMKWTSRNGWLPYKSDGDRI